MKLEYYPIRGRGETGEQFQLARIKDESGNMYKGEYDQARHFGSIAELSVYLAGVLKVDESELVLEKMYM